MNLRRAIAKGSFALSAGIVAVGLASVTGTTSLAGATSVSTTPVCTTSTTYKGATTCIELVSEGYGSYEVEAIGKSTTAFPSVFLTLTPPSGSTSSSTPTSIAAGGTVTFTSGVAAQVGQWCATATAVVPYINEDIDVTTTPPPCVTVPALPAPAGSSSQVCETPTEFPQFETCIDVTSTGAVIAEGYATVGGGTGFVTLTGPGSYTGSSTSAKVVAGQLVTFTGPTPPAAGQWCASFTVDLPALGTDLVVTGKTLPCLTIP